MSMQISVDPAALSQEQREAVAGFILAYPGSAGTCGHAVAEIPAFIHKDTADAGLVEVGRTIAPAVNELEVLQHDHESTLPVLFWPIPAAPVAAGATGPALDPEIAALVKDDGEFQASVAFGGHGSPALDADAAKLNAVFGQGAAGPTLADVGLAPAAAFGVPPVPLGVSVPLAVSTPAIAGASTVAPPPPANTAPITTTPGVASSVAGVDLDAKGMPWDNRIHAESKGKIADGTWRKKRNLDPTLLATVEAELRQLMGAPGVTPLAPTTAPIAPTPPLAPAAPVTANLPTASVSPAVAAPLPPAAPQAPVVGEVPADARAMFVALVGRASAAIQGQKVTQAEVNQCCADAGVPALPLLANRLDLVAQVAAHIDALIAARQ